MEEDINLRDYAEVIFKRKYIIILFAVLMSLLMGMPTLSKKELYEASATFILKNKQNNDKYSDLRAALGFRSGPLDNSFQILISSRAVAEQVLDRLNLAKRIKGWDNPEVNKNDLISAVQGIPKFLDKDGLFEIKVITEDPTLSADLANAFAEEGAKFWRKMNYTEARKRREYIENQLPRVDYELKIAEGALKKFSLITTPNVFSQPGVELKRLEREYDIHTSIYTMLRKEYASAKLEESEELDPFTIVDPAEKPIHPIKPKIYLSFLIGAVMGMMGGAFLAFGLEYWEKSVEKKQ